MRVLVFGAGVIGSVYAGKLLQAGHDVSLLARGQRLGELRSNGLILDDRGADGNRVALDVRYTGTPEGERYDLVLVAVRAEQLVDTLPVLAAMADGTDVLFFGNTAGRESEIIAALGDRVFFGFPAVGGTRTGPVVEYVMIGRQKTMLGEANGTITPRIRQIRAELNRAGFSTAISTDIAGWLLAHAAFVVPIAFALFRVGTDPARLAADRPVLRLMVRATRQGFAALRAGGNTEIPANLSALYRMPNVFVVSYWRRVFAGPRGELWFAAHTRAASDEMRLLVGGLLTAVHSSGRATPDLDLLTRELS
ncbi:2-dehydropantoate 2-reductase [Rhodococcus sp. AG1013]|uniref:ketopantoate reductase family protein n=1 Tax=Rhodococcus sp. AG1013 TaxID=2183996 RepID=UPI000E2E070B|nr:2-dehydropantoate 2-reductase N-terminal domain-containing protein [Rhodococcus sp. AG1013]RDI19476.1 2-dehydropantoate 2-reductase [Rhodococcus sp. AG1013]